MTNKLAFILDENVLIAAQTGYNERDEPDPTSFVLITDIIAICHSIVVDIDLWNRYQRLMAQPIHQPIHAGQQLIRLLNGAVQITDKFRGFEQAQAPAFPEESSIPAGSQDDVPVTVRLAVNTGAILVTSDEPLRAHLLSSGVTNIYGLTVVTPTEALDIVRSAI